MITKLSPEVSLIPQGHDLIGVLLGNKTQTHTERSKRKRASLQLVWRNLTQRLEWTCTLFPEQLGRPQSSRGFGISLKTRSHTLPVPLKPFHDLFVAFWNNFLDLVSWAKWSESRRVSDRASSAPCWKYWAAVGPHRLLRQERSRVMKAAQSPSQVFKCIWVF